MYNIPILMKIEISLFVRAYLLK